MPVTMVNAPGPALCGVLEDDALTLAEHVGRAEEELAGLPRPGLRDEDRRQLAASLVDSCRRARTAFLYRHAPAVYDALTDRRRKPLRLAGLARAAAERFPGLVPTDAQMAEEATRAQADKEGREIDQGIFFRALLADPSVGEHLIDSMLAPTPRALDLLSDFRAEGRVDLGSVLVERRDDVAHLTVNNQHCLNAEDNRLIDDLETAVDLVLLDDQISVGVVRGGVMTHPRYVGRRVFCAGINLKDLHAGRISFVDFLLRRELGYINKLMHGVLVDAAPDAYPQRTLHKPWLAAVDSFAIGGGMQLLLVFDHVIAADDAFLSLPAAQEGIVPGLGNFRLSRMTGARLARRVILGGRRIRATDPEATLVCDEVVAPEAMDAAVEKATRELAAPAVVANRMMLNLADESRDGLRRYLAEFALVQARRLYAADVMAKVDRFSAPSVRQSADGEHAP
ncbi:(3,5-dihydroxyphenyl)acetyl-CoA 1,2-dioxygenase DpgC [Streptomyces sp. NPDC058086]|uniref:(3,5-dihydroxyphenyl)acetyl-CoA 1,2-dioxygenase DpgC n=1 Tax=Streptomyces sp. NPDC058086 TaxID=3346334 RepID=UPI0036EAAA50